MEKDNKLSNLKALKNLIRIKKKFNYSFFLFFFIFLTGCTQIDVNNETIIQNQNQTQQGLIEISSQEELNDHMGNELINILTPRSNSMQFNSRDMALDGATQELSSSEFESSQEQVSTTDYSKTNIQTQGVDEADIVKTDGNYIYTLSQNKIIIVKKEDENTHSVIDEIKINGTNSNIVNFLIKDDKIIVFSQDYISHYLLKEESLIPSEQNSQVTTVSIYNNTQDSFSQVISHSVEGSYNDARLIDNYIYLISNKAVYDNINMPTVFRDSQPVTTSRTFIMPHIPSEQFTIISSLNLNDTQDFNSNSYMLDYSSTMYISKNNIYLISNNINNYDEVEEFKEVVLPLVTDNLNINEESSKEEIYSEFKQYFSSLSQDQQKGLYENIQKNLSQYYQNQQKLQSSQINKFSLNEGEINFETSAKVVGNLLNQFSLDEHNNTLRVATTLSYYDNNISETYLENFVTVYDENLNQISQIDSIAVGERIYSARFQQDTLYLVTFDQIDPFFVIDLNDPYSPKILGELKLPGFSNYLEVYNSTHVVGIGKETKENSRGGFEVVGLKISLFDVKDKLNPIEVDNYIIEEKYAQSESLYEHKAVLLDSNKEVLVIPIQENIQYGRNSEEEIESFQGAFVFSLKDSKITKQFQVEHEFVQIQNYWNNPNMIFRSLYIDDGLYTISQAGINVNNLNTSEQIDEIDFNYEEKQYDVIEPYYR